MKYHIRRLSQDPYESMLRLRQTPKAQDFLTCRACDLDRLGSRARLQTVTSARFCGEYRGDRDSHLSSLNIRPSLFTLSLVPIGNNAIVSFVLLLDIRPSQCFQSFPLNLLSPCQLLRDYNFILTSNGISYVEIHNMQIFWLS